MKRVLLTGATGFVGRSLAAILAQGGYEVRAAVRTDGSAVSGLWRPPASEDDCTLVALLVMPLDVDEPS